MTKTLREELVKAVLHWLKTAKPDDSDAPSVLVDAILEKIEEHYKIVLRRY